MKAILFAQNDTYQTADTKETKTQKTRFDKNGFRPTNEHLNITQLMCTLRRIRTERDGADDIHYEGSGRRTRAVRLIELIEYFNQLLIEISENNQIIE
jgi:hypothetical protein